MKTKPIQFVLVVLFAALCMAGVSQAADKKPNILVIWGDDVGQSNISAYSKGLMGYQTPNVDRIAREGIVFTDFMESSPARPAAHRSSWAKACFAPVFPRSACPEPRRA